MDVDFEKLLQPRKPEITHPVLGGMSSTKFGNGAYEWETVDELLTNAGSITVSLSGDQHGPNPRSVDLWQAVVADFDSWKAKAEPMIREELSVEGYDQRYPELKLFSFGVNEPGNKVCDWQVSFMLEPEYLLYTVQFKDKKPVAISVDG